MMPPRFLFNTDLTSSVNAPLVGLGLTPVCDVAVSNSVNSNKIRACAPYHNKGPHVKVGPLS
jgi:hypothetical protein